MLGLLHRSVLGYDPRHFRDSVSACSAVGFSDTKEAIFLRTGEPAIYKCWPALPSDLLRSLLSPSHHYRSRAVNS